MERSIDNKQNGHSPAFGGVDDLRNDLTHTREAFAAGKDIVPPIDEALARAKRIAARELEAAKKPIARIQRAAKTVGTSMQRAGASVLSTMKRNQKPMLIVGSSLLLSSGLFWLLFRNRKVRTAVAAVVPAIVKLAKRARPAKMGAMKAAAAATTANIVAPKVEGTHNGSSRRKSRNGKSLAR